MVPGISSTLLGATSLISPVTNFGGGGGGGSSTGSPSRSKSSSLVPLPGAPLSNDPTLVPDRYLEKDIAFGDDSEGVSSGANPHPTRSAPVLGSDTHHSVPISPSTGRPSRRPDAHLNLVRAPPSQLLDAPARAAMNMPNGVTAHAQARAVKGDPRTPDYHLSAENGDGYLRSRREEESVPLLSPTPQRFSNSTGGPLSRPSSAQSTASGRGVLRRIFIDRATTPSQHLTRPTFPPPSLSTYSPQPHTPLTLWAKIDLVIVQTISVILSTFFLAFVVSWAIAVEVARGLPRWVWPDKPRKFPWDDEKYWRKEGKKVSKDPADYAHQVGMDIEHQTVETEDGYYLK